MNRSIEGVVTFLQDNDSLIKQLMETAESATNEIEQLADRVGNAREEAQVLVDQLSAARTIRRSGKQPCWRPSPPCGRSLRPTRTTRCDEASMPRRSPICTCNWPTPSITRQWPKSSPSAPTKSAAIKT